MAEELLQKIYYDPEKGLGSIDKLYRAARAEAPEDVKITRGQVKEWLEKQPVHQRFRKVTNVYNPIVGKPGQVQMDLTFHRWQRKLIPILVVINLTSRYASATVLPDKKQETVVAALEDILDSKRGKSITSIESDAGSEFIGKQMAEMLRERDIELVLLQVGDKTSVGKVERMNLALKQLIERWKETHEKQDWREAIPLLMKNHNSAPHSALTKFLGVPTAPDDVTEADQEKIRTAEAAKSAAYMEALQEFEAGDKVRKLLQKNVCDKGSKPKWSSKIYSVGGFRGYSIVLEDDDMEGHFYRPRQVQKVAEGTVSEPRKDEAAAEEKRELRAERRIRREEIEPAAPEVIAEPRKLRERPVKPPPPEKPEKAPAKPRKKAEPKVFLVEEIAGHEGKGDEIRFKTKWQGLERETMEPLTSFLIDGYVNPVLYQYLKKKRMLKLLD